MNKHTVAEILSEEDSGFSDDNYDKAIEEKKAHDLDVKKKIASLAQETSQPS